VSVVVPSRDRPDSLRATLAGLVDQSLPADAYEVVVVDDGSRPPVPEPGQGVRLLRLPGAGRSAARNAGARAARGALLVFVDDDIAVGGAFLAAHLAAQEEWPGALAVGRLQLPEPVRATPFGRFRERLERQGVPVARGPVAAPNLCAAGNASLPRAAFEALGGFDARLASGEDQDLALRFSAAGGRIVYLPEALGTHDDGVVSFAAYCERARAGAEAMVAFCRKHPAWPENLERRRVLGPTRWGREPPGLSVRKTARALLARPAGRRALLSLASRLERRAPDGPWLAALYRALLGVHIQVGFRKGLLA
jgi:hypothetical protein